MKKAALSVLQVAVTLSVLYFLLRSPEKRAEMVRVVVEADLPWLLLGALMYIGIEIISAVRWNMLLRVQGVRLSLLRTHALVFIGVFFNFFIPGGTGGDVVKVFYLLKETSGQRAQALLATLIDRLLGMLAMVLLGGTIIAVQWDWLTAVPSTGQYLWTALTVLIVSVLGIAFSLIVSGMGWVHKLPARFPGRERLAELAMAYNLYSRAWPVSLLGLLMSAVVHVGYFMTFYCAARAYETKGLDLPSLREIFTIMPIVDTITALPISIAGLGVREGLFQVFLGDLAGVSAAAAMVIASTGFVLTGVSGAIGGAIYIFYRPSEHARMREMRASVEDIEHELAEAEIELEETVENVRS